MYKIEQASQPAALTCEYVETEPVLYFGTTGPHAIYCTDLFCRLVDQNCAAVSEPVSFNTQMQQPIKNVQLIRYNLTEGAYISQLMVSTENDTFQFCLCMGDERADQVEDKNGKLEFICRRKE